MKKLITLTLLAFGVLSPWRPAEAALRVTPTRIQLIIGGTSANEKILFDAQLDVIGTPTDPNPAIFLGVEDLALSFSIGASDAPPFYRVLIPRGGLFSTDDGNTFALTSAARDATGLERFTITRTAASRWNLVLADRKTSVSNLDYTTVYSSLTIGDDLGTVGSTLVRAGGTWSLPGK